MVAALKACGALMIGKSAMTELATSPLGLNILQGTFRSMWTEILWTICESEERGVRSRAQALPIIYMYLKAEQAGIV